MSSQEPIVEPDHVLDSPEAGRTVIEGSTLRLVGFGISLAVGVLTAPLLIRHLSVAEFGIYATVGSILFMITGLTEGGIGNVGVREYAQGEASARAALLRHLLGLRWALMIAGITAALTIIEALDYPREVFVGVAIGALGALVGALQHTISIPLASALRLGRLTVIDLSRQLASTALMVALVIVGASVVPFFWVYVAGFVAMVIVTVCLISPPRLLLPAIDRKAWGYLLRQTGLFAFASAISVVYFQVALVSVAALSGAEQAGLYGAAFRVVDVLNGIPWLIAASAFPIVARSALTDRARLQYALQRMFETMVVASGGLVVLLVVGTPAILTFIGGEKVLESATALRLMAFGLPLTFCIAIWSYALLSLRASRRIVVVTSIALFTALVLSVLVVPEFGASGAGAVTLTVEVTLASAYLIALRGIDRDLQPRMRVLPKGALAVAAGLATGFLTASILTALPIILASSAGALVGTLIYLLAIVALRAVPDEITTLVLSRVRRNRSYDD